MSDSSAPLTRRSALGLLGTAGAALTLGRSALAQQSLLSAPAPTFSGPGPLDAWNGLGPLIALPQKVPLIRLVDRPPLYETPRSYFQSAFTPTAAFFVRTNLSGFPASVDLGTWRLKLSGNVNKPVSLSLAELLRDFEAVSVNAVMQCTGNSRARFQPRRPGGQWGNGAMGCATWTGVRLRDLLDRAGLKPGGVQVQFQGLDTGAGAPGSGGASYQKSLNLDDPVLDECIVAYAMNGQPLPLVNGFPVRLVVPGYFATYWMKTLSFIRVLTQPDDNFWMTTAYLQPDNARGNTTPQAVKDKTVKLRPVGSMPVRSFIVTPDETVKVPAGLPMTVQGLAMSGRGKVNKVEVSSDGGKTWSAAKLGEDHGRYAFRPWTFAWTPKKPGQYTLAVRATDTSGGNQPDGAIWNPSGYLWTTVERQTVTVGQAG
ncbi:MULTISPECIES: molybdopterin-dependent oxidoreductase [Deinococcus]|uniref:DMSO/TMAO reductase YedYZ molybdopterin-dependent catalytic subunit n=2 Tax=Deinococcus TaxID=1298 RepID=A0A7W8JYU8_9DEIO|nr:molybdopterin-dependent oxidoreductase [Deinococcus humi]MBB5364443.1 DMSO/TMAO reductase YedYZ molybdopterin-dependent catalytic subunit [Deinococcus humi]GGO33082.1 oxidase [Deinococcus humi]